MTSTAPRPASDWLEALPTHRLMTEMSLWSAGLGHLADELQRIEPYTDIFHIDVADGHFSPAFLFFPDQVAAMRKKSKIPIHIHLMVADNVLLSIHTVKSAIGLAWLSVASGDLRVAEVAPQALDNELRRIAPAEILAADGLELPGYTVTRLPYLDPLNHL